MKAVLFTLFCTLWSFNSDAKTKFVLGAFQVAIDLPQGWKVVGKQTKSQFRMMNSIMQSARVTEQCSSVPAPQMRECQASAHQTADALRKSQTIEVFSIKGPKIGDEIVFEAMGQAVVKDVETSYISFAKMFSPSLHQTRNDMYASKKVAVWITALPQLSILMNYIVDLGETHLTISSFCMDHHCIDRNPKQERSLKLWSHKVIEELLKTIEVVKL
jgi:hypothetical protein